MTPRTLTRTTIRHAAEANAPLRAVIYTRISADKEGQELGVTRQRQDALAMIERRGYTLAITATGSEAGEYRDNDRGASTRSRKARPAFVAMLAAVKNGEADVIVCYSASRLTRRPAEWEEIIRLVESSGVQIHTCVSGDANFATADGRAVARTIAAWDAAEAERTAERVARAHAQKREQGLPNWPRRPFGNERDGSLNVAEATAVRDAAERIIRGSSLAGVCRTWRADGATTANGAHWTSATLGDMLRSPRVAGLMPDGATPGAWSAVLPVGTWHAMCAALDRSKHRAKGGAPGRLAWLLSGIATCEPCGATVAIRWLGGMAAGRPYYTCRNGHVSVSAPEADAHIRAGVIQSHSRLQTLLTDAAVTVDTAPMIEEVRRITAKIEEVRAAYAADAIELADMTAITANLRRDRDATQARLNDATIADARSRSAEVLAAEWDGLDLAQRRAVLQGLNLSITIARGFGWTVAERITVSDAAADPAAEVASYLD